MARCCLCFCPRPQRKCLQTESQLGASALTPVAICLPRAHCAHAKCGGCERNTPTHATRMFDSHIALHTCGVVWRATTQAAALAKTSWATVAVSRRGTVACINNAARRMKDRRGPLGASYKLKPTCWASCTSGLRAPLYSAKESSIVCNVAFAQLISALSATSDQRM